MSSHIWLEPPEMDAVLILESYKSQGRLSQPAGHTFFDVAQDTLVFLGCQLTLTALIKLLINGHPQEGPHILLLWVVLNLVSPKTASVLGISPAQMQYLALGHIELQIGSSHKSTSQACQGSSDSISALQIVNSTTQFGVISKLAKGAPDPTAYAAEKDIKLCWSCHCNIAPHWSPLGH